VAADAVGDADPRQPRGRHWKQRKDGVGLGLDCELVADGRDGRVQFPFTVPRPQEPILAGNLTLIISRLTQDGLPGALSRASVAAQSATTGQSGRNRNIDGCPRNIDSALLRARITVIR
jgi:hypothetical protein